MASVDFALTSEIGQPGGMEVRAVLRRLRYVFLMRQLFDMLDYIYYIPSPSTSSAIAAQDLDSALKQRLNQIKARVRHSKDPGEALLGSSAKRQPYALWEKLEGGVHAISPFTPWPMLFPMKAVLVSPQIIMPLHSCTGERLVLGMDVISASTCDPLPGIVPRPFLLKPVAERRLAWQREGDRANTEGTASTEDHVTTLFSSNLVVTRRPTLADLTCMPGHFEDIESDRMPGGLTLDGKVIASHADVTGGAGASSMPNQLSAGARSRRNATVRQRKRVHSVTTLRDDMEELGNLQPVDDDSRSAGSGSMSGGVDSLIEALEHEAVPPLPIDEVELCKAGFMDFASMLGAKSSRKGFSIVGTIYAAEGAGSKPNVAVDGEAAAFALTRIYASLDGLRGVHFLRPVTRRGFRATREVRSWLDSIPSCTSSFENPFLRSLRNSKLAVQTGRRVLRDSSRSPADRNASMHQSMVAADEEPLLCEAFLYTDRWCVAVDLGVERRAHPPQASQEAEELHADATNDEPEIGSNASARVAGGLPYAAGGVESTRDPGSRAGGRSRLFRRITSSPM